MTAPVPSLDCERVGATSLRKTMLGITAITDIVSSNIHWEDIPEDDVTMPYITIHYVSGGWENETDSNAADIQYLVIGHTASKRTAADLRNALSLLHREVLDTSVFSSNNVRAYARIRKEAPYYKKDDGQNLPIFMIGGIYRVRLTIV